jgi:hypothetical protein
MNSDVILSAAGPNEESDASPARDYPAEPVRSQWVVDLVSHRVVRRAPRSPRPAHGSSDAS